MGGRSISGSRERWLPRKLATERVMTVATAAAPAIQERGERRKGVRGKDIPACCNCNSAT